MTERTIVADEPKCPKCYSVERIVSGYENYKCYDCGCVYTCTESRTVESTEVQGE